MTYGSTSANQNTDTTHIATQPTPLMMYGYTSANQNHQSTGMATPITNMSESLTFPRTTMPVKTTPSLRQSTSEIHQNSSCSGPPTCCIHVHRPQSQTCKLGEPPAWRKVKTPHNGKTSVSRSPLAKQNISSQYSGCFEGIGHFPGDPYRFHLKPDYQPATHASKKQGISKEVNEHTDWVHSNIIVEKALEGEPHYTHSTGEITTEFPGRMARHFPTHMEMCMDDHLTQTIRENPTTVSPRHQTCRIPTRHGKYTSFPREPVPARKREEYGYRYIYIREHYSEQVPYAQHTHTPRESSTELPTTEDRKFQHGGTSILQSQC